MKIVNDKIKGLIDAILSDEFTQEEIDTLSFFIYPHTTKYKAVYRQMEPRVYASEED